MNMVWKVMLKWILNKCMVFINLRQNRAQLRDLVSAVNKAQVSWKVNRVCSCD